VQLINVFFSVNSFNNSLWRSGVDGCFITATEHGNIDSNKMSDDENKWVKCSFKGKMHVCTFEV